MEKSESEYQLRRIPVLCDATGSEVDLPVGVGGPALSANENV